MQVFEVRRPAGGVLRAYDTGSTGRADEVVAFWHGGTPNTGEPPEPLLAAAADHGVRLLGADRPRYGGSTRDPAAGIGDVVPDVLAVADAVGVDRLVALGHSGGGPRALACAALGGRRVRAAIAVSSPAPPDATGLDRFAGMAPGIVQEQEAATQGREALHALVVADEFDVTSFTAGDFAALRGGWSWFERIVAEATAGGVEGQVDDLLAAARPWGFDPGAIAVPVLVVHGGADRMVPPQQGAWLAARIPGATAVTVPGAGHIDVLERGPDLVAAVRDLA